MVFCFTDANSTYQTVVVLALLLVCAASGLLAGLGGAYMGAVMALRRHEEREE